MIRWIATGLVLMMVCMAVSAQPSVDAKAKAKAQALLKRMAEIEKKAAAVEPMLIPLKGRTAAQDKEMVRRIEFLDNLNNTEVNALVKDVSLAQLPGPLNPVRDAADALSLWIGTKLSLQNAGVNNPSLQALQKNEPLHHRAFQDAYKKAMEVVQKA